MATQNRYSHRPVAGHRRAWFLQDGPQGCGYSGCFRSVALPDRKRRTSDTRLGYGGRIAGCNFP